MPLFFQDSQEQFIHMTPIQVSTDVESFKGRLVAFQTTSFYFSHQHYKLENKPFCYGLIAKTSERWNGERGYEIFVLLNRELYENSGAGTSALIESTLKGSKMMMREVSSEERELIFRALHDNQATLYSHSNVDSLEALRKKVFIQEETISEVKPPF